MRSTSALPYARVAQMAAGESWSGPFIDELVALSVRGLPKMYNSSKHEFVQTTRRDEGSADGLHREGVNLRYAAIVALGLSACDEATQRVVLGGETTADLARTLATQALDASDLGAVALAAWAVAELDPTPRPTLFERLAGELERAQSVPTVVLAWSLTAFLAAPNSPDHGGHIARAAARLLAAQGKSGIFPHVAPADSLGRYRAHVGCFADQVYPIQALTRCFLSTHDPAALEAANECAEAIVRAQGTDGQWWWHYDARIGGVVEGFPVYSVHQHAMGPMALLELAEAGGADHREAVLAGLQWLRTHPETQEELIDPVRAVVWRKVGRREPRKVVRSVRAVTTAFRPTLRMQVLDRVFPPGPIDHECRPYELGWLLYAWLGTPRHGAAVGRDGEDNDG